MVELDIPRWARTSLLVASLPVSLACSNKQVSGQTGSPDDEHPDYTSPTRFTPSDGSTETDGGNGLGGFYDLLNWVFPSEPAELVQLDGDTLVVFAPPEQYTGPASDPRQLGLQLYDASAPTPTKLGELAIAGWPHRMHLDTDAVNLVILQTNTEEYESIPEATVPRQITRLLRIDRSDPNAPELLGSVDIEGDYARSVQVGSRVVVVSQIVEPTEVECNPDGGSNVTLDLYEPPSELPDGETRIVSYEFANGGFEVAYRVTLDGLHQVASTAAEGLVLHRVEALDDESFVSNLLLVAASEDDGALTPGEPLALSGSLDAALWHDGLLSTAQSLNGVEEYRVYDSSDIASLVSLGSTSLSLPGVRIVSDGGNLVLVDPSDDTGVQGQATLIDLADPANPSAVKLAGARGAEFTPNGVVGVAERDTGHSTLRLWDVTDPSAPALSAEAETDWPFTYFKIAPYPPGPGFPLQAPSAFYDSRSDSWKLEHGLRPASPML